MLPFCFVLKTCEFEKIVKDPLKEFSIWSDETFRGYCDSGEEVEELLNKLKSLGFSYSVRRSSQQNSPHASRNNPGFFFQLLKGKIDIKFFGPLFSVENMSYRECILGPQYREKRETDVPSHLADHVNPTAKRIRLMDTRKGGCPATFLVKCVRIYRDYTIKSTTERWEIKKKVTDRLKQDLLSQREPYSFLRFYVVVSPPRHHTHDPECIKVIGDIHPKLANEIMNVVKNGITSVKVIRLHLCGFVNSNFVGENRPDCNNAMFYPTERTIYNHVCNALQKLKKTPIDQDSLQMQVDEWKSENKGDNIYFRQSSGVEESQQLIFCYQSRWQKELLKKYGAVCLLDATYKTTKYDIPLFLITVKTNVCYLVVGFFFIQMENTRSIQEALGIFKLWNPELSPKYWVTDFSEPEIKAIENTFPSSEVYLCSFHREQAWHRWLGKSQHLSEATDKDTTLNLWRQIAASSSEESFAVNKEKWRNHVVSQRNLRAVAYLETKWLPVSSRWVKAFRCREMFAAINTTNGAESMNNVVKSSVLKHNTDKTLTGVVKILVTRFLPDQLRKYCEENSSIKLYNKELPIFLHGKTRHFSMHVLRRYNLVETEFTREMVSKIDEGLFCVRSTVSQNCNYIVDFSQPSCTCADFQEHKYLCKHFCAIFYFIPEWGFHKINENYRTNPLICLDSNYGIGKNNHCSAQIIPPERVEDTGNIGGRKEQRNIAKAPSSSPLGQMTRELCSEIANLTYNCDAETLKKIFEDLQRTRNFAVAANPKENGLPLTMPSTSRQ